MWKENKEDVTTPTSFDQNCHNGNKTPSALQRGLKGLAVISTMKGKTKPMSAPNELQQYQHNTKTNSKKLEMYIWTNA